MDVYLFFYFLFVLFFFFLLFFSLFSLIPLRARFHAFRTSLKPLWESLADRNERTLPTGLIVPRYRNSVFPAHAFLFCLSIFIFPPLLTLSYLTLLSLLSTYILLYFNTYLFILSNNKYFLFLHIIRNIQNI